MIEIYVEGKQPKRAIELTVVAQDPSVKVAGRVITAPVKILAEHLLPGPLGHRIRVVDYDATKRTLRGPGPLVQSDDLTVTDRFADASDRTLVSDPDFHAQNVFAIAASTLDHFESALGRRVPWSFREHQLYLVPHAFEEANAFYSEEDHAVFFGYFEDVDGKTAYSALSHDIVAHETTHAILDGLRARYELPGLPDQPAFHEAFADIVALLSVFSLKGVVENLLGTGSEGVRIKSASVTDARLRQTALVRLAEQLGESARGTRTGLRDSVNLPVGAAWKDLDEFREPHRRGEVLVAAVMQALLHIWTGRLEAITTDPTVDRARVAEEGAKAADHLLHMAIRAVDYCPPLEFEFADFLDALLVADQEMDPDDALGYRTAVEHAFNEYGIERPETSTIDVLHDRLVYSGFNYTSLRSSPDEVFRFIWENRATLRLDPTMYTFVENVRPSTRVGPDGFVVNEVLVDYVQSLRGRPADIAKRLGSRFELPASLPADKEIQIWGGGVLIFDQFGRAKLHQRKAIDEPLRQSARLRYLAEEGLRDRQGRVGFSLGVGSGRRFAELHANAARSREAW